MRKEVPDESPRIKSGGLSGMTISGGMTRLGTPPLSHGPSSASPYGAPAVAGGGLGCAAAASLASQP